MVCGAVGLEPLAPPQPPRAAGRYSLEGGARNHEPEADEREVHTVVIAWGRVGQHLELSCAGRIRWVTWLEVALHRRELHGRERSGHCE